MSVASSNLIVERKVKEMNEYKVAGSLVNGNAFSVVVKAKNVFHAMVIAEKYKTNGVRVKAMSAVRVVA